MATRTPAQVFALLKAQGASDDAARILTEIAGAESGYDDTATGDVGLEDSTWGPSYGLWQIRTLKSQTGTGGDRDISALASSDQTQAAAALSISGDGANFKPWTTYNTGRYQQFASQVDPLAGGGTQASPVSTPVTPVGGPLPTFGPSWLPWNWPSDLGNSAISSTAQSVFGSIRTIVLEGMFAVFGVSLIVVGAKHLAQPAIDKTKARAEKAEQTAAELAPLAAL